MKRSIVVLSLVTLLGFLTADVPAELLTFVHEGRGSGTFNGISFSNLDFIITGVGDTNNRDSFHSGYFVDHMSATISINGLSDYEFITKTRTFVNNSISLVGFSQAGQDGLDLFNGPTNSEFATWDMLSSIGPFNGEGNLWSSASFDTTGGVLRFGNRTTDASFFVIPEPTTLSLLTLGAFLAGRRRKELI